MLGTVTTAAAELQAAGEAAGLDAEHVFWILARLVPSLELRRAGYVNGRHRPTLFALRDLLKDLDLALDLFHRSGGAVPMAALVRELIDEAARTAADIDISAVITRYQHDTAELAPGGASSCSASVCTADVEAEAMSTAQSGRNGVRTDGQADPLAPRLRALRERHRPRVFDFAAQYVSPLSDPRGYAVG
jgi:NAD-binding of NADP-dependent 3-hydroxyisobutyrate dehydrogenase